MPNERYPMPEQDFPLPPEYAYESDAFKRAFVHAKRFRNPDKAALAYATAHADDFEDVPAPKRQRGRGSG